MGSKAVTWPFCWLASSSRDLLSRRLERLGRSDLAAQVSWVARQQGDGLGHDVQSLNPDGSTIHIEVMTTSNGAEEPFYVSTVELKFSRRHPRSYALYRGYCTRRGPMFYALYGDIASLLELAPSPTGQRSRHPLPRRTDRHRDRPIR